MTFDDDTKGPNYTDRFRRYSTSLFNRAKSIPNSETISKSIGNAGS